MVDNIELKKILDKMENVLEQAIELKDENRELKIKLAKYEDEDEELDQNLKDFQFKLEKYGQLTDRGITSEIIKSREENDGNIKRQA